MIGLITIRVNEVGRYLMASAGRRPVSDFSENKDRKSEMVPFQFPVSATSDVLYFESILDYLVRGKAFFMYDVSKYTELKELALHRS